MGDARIYLLISELYAMRGRWEPALLEAAEAHVEKMSGIDGKALHDLLSALRRWSQQEGAKVPVENSSVQRADVEELAELQAILEDLEFIPERRDLASVAEQLVGSPIIGPSDTKRSRAELVRRIVHRFAKLESGSRQAALARLRRRHARGRKGSLEGWSENISSTK